MFIPMKHKRIEVNDIIMHFDYDKTNEVLYDNIYFKKNNHILKTPVITFNKEMFSNDLKIEKFDLTKYIYLFHY